MSQHRVVTTGIVLLLVGFGIVARLMPHPPNFVPIAAIALFAGFLFGPRLTTLAIPLASMCLADLVLGGYDWRVMCVVYCALALPVAMAAIVRGRPSLAMVFSATMASSVVFFATTNFAVWYFGSLYSHDANGLVECYVAALPFFKHTCTGDLLWSMALFGAYCFASMKLQWHRPLLALNPVRGR